MIRIQDPLHGTIALGELEERLVDSWQMQRLRGVRQLAMAYLVYPGANHTRFEHSLGTLSLADKICGEVGLGRDDTEKVRCAALLHDVGHTAFSHEAEAVLKKRIGDHEKIGRGIATKGEIADIVSESFRPAEIANICKTPLGDIITSDIGADRMDYLLRDSHYTGVAYGVIDSGRICSTLRLSKKGLHLSERGLEAAESLLVARFAMFSTVYLHKTVRIASRMLQEAIACALEDGALIAKDAIWMADSEMLSALLESRKGREHAMRLRERRLYKKAHALPLNSFLKGKISKEKAEEMLSEKCSCSVHLDVPSLSLEASMMVEKNGRMRPISAASGIVGSLEKMQKNRLDVLVMCEGKNAAKVQSAAKKML